MHFHRWIQSTGFSSEEFVVDPVFLICRFWLVCNSLSTAFYTAWTRRLHGSLLPFKQSNLRQSKHQFVRKPCLLRPPVFSGWGNITAIIISCCETLLLRLLCLRSVEIYVVVILMARFHFFVLKPYHTCCQNLICLVTRQDEESCWSLLRHAGSFLFSPVVMANFF